VDKLQKILFDPLEQLCVVLMVIPLVAMIVFIFVQVVSRYAFNSPSSWTEELSRHLMIWAAFLGAAVAYRKNAHLGVDLLLESLSAKPKRIVLLLVHAGIAVFSAFLIATGYQVVSKTMHQLSSALGVPMGYIYLSIPVGASVMLIFSLEKLYGLAKGQDIGGKMHIIEQ
jgi:TRAP-type C4-dicarboxylate transport system permease small subunit